MLKLFCLLLCAMLAACASAPDPSGGDLGASPWAHACKLGNSSALPEGATWQHLKFPGKRPNLYASARIDGRDALRMESASSVSMVRHKLRIDSAKLRRVEFSWKVPRLIPGADMAARDTDDAPARLVLAFEGDRSKLSGRNQMMSELARALTGEEMPYATLMYVWANDAPVGSVIINSRTDRIRKLVVESGPGALNQWQHYQRDIRADYEKAFGETPGALLGVAVMSDTDNTRSTATAWYGSIKLD